MCERLEVCDGPLEALEGTDELLLAGRDLAAFSPQAQTTTASTSTRTTPAPTQSSSA
jgi:hypothetical protein